MAEATKVRLVRCPRCENLLPELPDFSLYQCGGCGAVLKAKNKGILEDVLSEISYDVNGVGISKEGSIINMSDIGMKSTNGIEHSSIDRIDNQRVASGGSSTSRAENGEVLADFDASRRGKERIRRLKYYDDENGLYSQGLVRNRNQGEYCDLNMSRPEYVHFQGEQWRFDNFPYHDEEPLNYEMSSHYEQAERTRYRDRDLNGFARVENLEHGRVELIRKIDELKDQLSRSCGMADKHQERMTPPDPYDQRHNVYVQEGLTNSHGVNKQPFATNNLEVPYLSHIHGCVPGTSRYISDVQDSYPPRNFPHDFKGYSDTDPPKMLQRPPWQPPSDYMHRPYHDDFHGYYRDINHEPFMLHPHENFFHQPSCSCVHCCNRNWYIPPKTDPYRSLHEPYNSRFHHHPNPIMHVPQGYSSGDSNSNQLHSRQSQTLHSHDLDNESDSLNYRHARKFVVGHRNGRVCHPIARGAPFITCCDCFELLKLPRKHMSSAKNLKMKCGACFSVILFELGSEGFTGSVSAHIDPVLNEIDDGSSRTINENSRDCHGDSNDTDMKVCSNNYDDSKTKYSPIDSKSTSAESEKQLDPLSSTSSISEDEHSLDNVTSERHGSSSAELPLTEVNPFPCSDCSQDCPDHCSDNNTARFDKGNTSKRSESALDRTTSSQIPINDAAMAADIDVSVNEFSYGCVSQDSVEISREDHPRVNEGGESFFEGLKKKIFHDFSEYNQSSEVGESKVFVNGHFIPDREVKKAEELAGPIQPGDYWYDIQAGFWGVMGHPCLGIIMPNIEEFNYPLPENCAAGNTGVFVNGRELHQKDLDILAGRGLPIIKNRSYIVEISGEVTDEQTGEELGSLGKLAPTVAREKHGFGMRVP